MATLGELRAYVRRQTETTSAELPNVTVDAFLREAFNRTVNAEVEWPSYQQQWTLTLPVGERRLPLPADVARPGIQSLLYEGTSGTPSYRLHMVNHETAEDVYTPAWITLARHAEFSLWGQYLYLWPRVTFATPQTYTLRGYRLPRDWIGNGLDTNVVDADPRLHWPLAHYAIALAYAQQEDEQLENVYMQRWQRDVEQAHKVIMQPAHDQPITFGGGKRDHYWRGGTGFQWSLP